MKKLIFSVLALAFIACNSGSSKKKTEFSEKDPVMEQRLAEYIKLNEEMNFEKLMDYIYPKLFTLAPRKQMQEAMEDFFKSEDLKVEMQDMKIEKVYPIFQIGNGSYAKVIYSMVMLMDFTPKDSLIKPEETEQNERIMQAMAEKYGKENVSIDPATGVLRIYTSNPMVAVKDEMAKEWSFVGLQEDPMIDKLFSKEVQDKLATYK